MDGIDDFDSPPLEAELACHYRVPHVRCTVRTRVMCQAGRARAAGARGDIVAWLCERAPLWASCTCAPCCVDEVLVDDGARL